ncbi:zf-DHHC-domain-containing protein [Phellopilus nigrolimitatus]|nr:zf-DHHC-domain-containing protein [Phellopilus nigrolimitatus]
MGRLLGRIWVGFTVSLIAFIAYSSQIFIIWPWYGRVLTVDLLTLLLPFNFLVGLLFWNYFLTVSTDPGRVPKSWMPDTHSGEGYEVKRLTGNPRYCRMCDAYKPPRAHHCRQCRRCVLRMDHHCPWVNNCVGHFNYGHFIRFLFFVDIACSYHAIMVTRRAFDAMNTDYWDGPSTVEFVFIILNYVTCIPVLLGVGGFSLYHFYCLSKNTTTIEGWEKDKVATLVKKGKIHEVKFPYNIGRRENIETVLGRNPLLWCCPSVPPGDGLRFQVVEADDEQAQAWPPEDPTSFRVHADYAYDGDGDERALDLPASPWTYENGSVNPTLEPSNAYRRASKGTTKSRPKQRQTASRTTGFVASVPPYHPDYAGGSDGEFVGAGHVSSSASASEEDYDSDECRYNENNNGGGSRVRLGSEGYEVQPVDREEVLRRYILSRGAEAGHFRRYVPESGSGSHSGEESEDGQGRAGVDLLPIGVEP